MRHTAPRVRGLHTHFLAAGSGGGTRAWNSPSGWDRFEDIAAIEPALIPGRSKGLFLALEDATESGEVYGGHRGSARRCCGRAYVGRLGRYLARLGTVGCSTGPATSTGRHSFAIVTSWIAHAR